MITRILASVTMLCAAVVLSAQAPAPEAVYQIKSGVITTEMDMMGQKMVLQQYFDDYGKKQATVSDFGNGKMRGITLDGALVMIDETARTATRMPDRMGGGAGQNRINFASLTDEVIKQFQIKELGEETIAGKVCKKYSVTRQSPMGGDPMAETCWIYKGITLKRSNAIPMELTATKLEEDVEVPASMFTVPEGIQVKDADMSMFGGF